MWFVESLLVPVVSVFQLLIICMLFQQVNKTKNGFIIYAVTKEQTITSAS